MKILLEQVITGEKETRITLIDSTVDTQQDAKNAYDAINGFEDMVIASGTFNDNDHIHLEINGVDIGYGQIMNHWGLITFLKANQ